MKKRSNSQPKFKKVYTSRIRDGRYSNQKDHKVNNYMSAQKPKKYQNPQSPAQTPRKNHKQRQDYQKYGINFIKTDADSPVKRIADQEPPKIKLQNRKQETFNGRKLQYPHEVGTKGGYSSNNNNNQSKIQRAQSASLTSSRHYVDRSKKSRQIIQKNAVDNEKVKLAIEYLFQNNADYFAERSSLHSQKARPRQQIFKINLAQTPSTYKNHYPPKQAPYELYMQPQNTKTANSFGPTKVTGNSKNNQVHNGVQGPKADLSTWPQGFKLQGPIDATTSYANRYPDHGDFQKMVPIATFNEHPMGFAHKTNSTNRDHFNGKGCPASDLARWNNLHPYGNNFNPDRGTQSSDKHNTKGKNQIQNWPNYDPRLLVSKGKFSTEYRDRIVDQHQHQLNEQNSGRYGRQGRPVKKRTYK